MNIYISIKVFKKSSFKALKNLYINQETKGFFLFEIIINILVSFRTFECYGSTAIVICLILSVRGCPTDLPFPCAKKVKQLSWP